MGTQCGNAEVCRDERLKSCVFLNPSHLLFVLAILQSHALNLDSPVSLAKQQQVHQEKEKQ